MLSRIMTVSYKKETLTDWLDRFLSLTEEKFSSSKFVFSAKEHESFGNAFNICLIEDNYVVDVFWDGLGYTHDSTFEEIKADILELVEKNKTEYENIVKVVVAKRSDSVQNLDFLDLSYDGNSVTLVGHNFRLYPKDSKVYLYGKEYTVDEYIKETV